MSNDMMEALGSLWKERTKLQWAQAVIREAFTYPDPNGLSGDEVDLIQEAVSSALSAEDKTSLHEWLTEGVVIEQRELLLGLLKTMIETPGFRHGVLDMVGLCERDGWIEPAVREAVEAGDMDRASEVIIMYMGI